MTADANFAATLRSRAQAEPGQTALVEPAGQGGVAAGWRRTTFGELDGLADRYAIGLTRAGVRAGDRVLYLLRPCAEGYAVFYALLRLGAIPAFIDPRMSLPRLLACVEAIRPRVVVAVPALLALRLVAQRAFAAVEVFITSGPRWLWSGRNLRQCLAESGTFAPAPVTPETECYLPFTSGSTGLAKGVYYTHGMVRGQAALVREVCGWREGMRVVMCYAPFVPFALADGLTVILPRMDFSRPAAADPRRIAEAVTAHRAEYAFASPIVWMNLACHGERARVTLPTLQHAIAAGAPVPARLHSRLVAMLHPEGRLHTPYGATEAMPLTTTDTHALAETWEASRSGYGTCIGRPLPGIQLQVIRVTDDPIPSWSDDLRVPQGTIGEIVVEGDVVSPAYPDLPEETNRAKIRCGGRVLHRTGDLGRVDPQGRVWFCGRKSHRIDTRDGMLASVSLENIYNEHPGVFRSAVVGVGPAGAQTPVGCVELEAGVGFSPRLVAELTSLADATPFQGRITRFLPHRGFPVDPRHNSKIRREELAAWAARRLGRHATSA
jgi:acyl-CoA synthetase (AMP-forming)/AMP-acid ligase II